MTLRKLFQRLTGNDRRKKETRRRTRRLATIEAMERRQLLVANLGVIEGNVFVDDGGTGVGGGGVGSGNVSYDAGEELVIDGSNNRVAPGTGGATGVLVELFNDVNTDGALTAADGAAIDSVTSSTTDGSYRFDGLSPGQYLVQQADVNGFQTLTALVVNVVDDDGTQVVDIDDFSTTSQSVTATGSSSADASSAATEAVGGNRDIQATNAAATGQVDTIVDAGSNFVSFAASFGVTGSGLVQYDGADGAITLNATGLGNLSLGGGAAAAATDPDAGFVLQAGAQLADDLTITVYTSATDFSSATVSLPTGGTIQEVFVRFTDFSQGTGATAPADFNDVGAIEALVELTNAGNDAVVDIIETITPTIVPQALLNVATPTTLTLGGEIFIDNFFSATPGSNSQNDGIRDTANEPGLVGVDVELYSLAGAGDVLDPATVTQASGNFIAATVTGVNGRFDFAGLAPGNYAAVVRSTQTSNPTILTGLIPSTGGTVTDPDDNVNDDNEATVAGNGDFVTGTITLESGSEPVDDGDTDNTTNFSLDIGLIPEIDLGITKTDPAAPTQYRPGDTVTFNFVVENDSDTQATNVVVTDVIPTGLTLVPLTGGQTTGAVAGVPTNFTVTDTAGTLTIDVGTVAANTTVGNANTVTFPLSFTVDVDQTADITNTASIATNDQVDTNTANDSESEVVDLISTDLTIAKTDQTDPVSAGSQFVYEFTVTNNSADTATGVNVFDELPDDVTFVSATVSGGAVTVTPTTNGNGREEITVPVGTVAGNSSVTVLVTVAVGATADGVLTNTATVSNTPDTDPDDSNNTSNAETTTLQRDVDLAIAKVVEATATTVSGGQTTFEVTLSNNGPGVARGIQITDTLDAAFSFVSFDANGTGVTVGQVGQVLTFTVPDLAQTNDSDGITTNDSLVFTYVVDIASSATGSINNTAAVTTTDTDTDATNDSSTVAVATTQEIDLILTKTAASNTDNGGTVDIEATPGQATVTYTFTVSHDTDSFSDATNVNITDTLPAGLSNVTINAANAASTNFNTTTNVATVVYTSIAAGATETFTITATVDSDATGTITNSASATSDGVDLDLTNQSASAAVLLTPDFDIVVGKTVNNAAPQVGSNVVYTITVTNEGPSTATGVVLSDIVPTGLTFVSGSMDGNAATETAGTVTFPALDFAPSQTRVATLTFLVDSTATGTIANSASVPDLSANGENDTTNNTGTVNITPTEVVDVTISKSVNDSTVVAGQTVIYTVTATNNGPSSADAVTITDTLPSGVTFVSGTGPNGEVLTAVGQVVTFDGGTITSGAGFTITINATVNSGAAGTLTNSSTVSTTTAESNTTNNTATAASTIDPNSASISGTVFEDSDNDGVQDTGEAGIAGVTLQLTGTDNNGNSVTRTTATDSNGDYVFALLAAGTYTVTEIQPANFDDGTETAGTGATSSTTGEDLFTDLVLAEGAAAEDFNFAELSPRLSKRRFLNSST